MTYTKEREDFFVPPSQASKIPEGKALTVGFKRLSENATIPTKAHATDSGFDLCANADVIIEPGSTVIVPTDIALDLPAGYEAQIRPRSGVTAKTKLRVQLGTIDNGYSGALGVIVDNVFREQSMACRNRTYFVDGKSEINRNSLDINGTYVIRKGDRIAQLVIQRLPEVIGVEVSDVGESTRGAGAFGSTGV